MTHGKFLKYLTEQCLYLDARIKGDKFHAIYPLMYTHAIISGTVGNEFFFDDRWCYHTYTDAKKALDAWDGTGEPKGWTGTHPAAAA